MKKSQKLHKGTILLFIFTIVSSILLIIYQIMLKEDNPIFSNNIVTSIFFVFVYICILVFAIYYLDKNRQKIIIFFSILFLLFNSYQVSNIIHVTLLKEDIVVENFYGKNITEVISWAEKHGVLIDQTYEYSDTLDKYLIIRQDIKEGTVLKDIKTIKVVVSNGIDKEKDASIPNMVGWSLDEALKFIEENFLTNVEINFEYHKSTRETIISQSIVGADLKRNDKITLGVSLGNVDDVVEARMDNLVGKSLRDAEIFLKRNRINYKIEYAYFDGIEDDVVASQSINYGFMVRSTDKEPVIITVSKKDQITVPDLKSMSQTEITKWATTNKLKVYFEEEYDDTIIKGRVIESTILEGEVVKPDTSFTVTISKGRLVMIRFSDVDEFRSWADENKVSYKIEYEFSDLDSGKVISSTHKTGEVIKNSDTIYLVISQGNQTVVPNFVGKTKNDALKLCSDSKLKCTIVLEESDKISNTVIKQSMRKDSKVPVNTSITLTVSE